MATKQERVSHEEISRLYDGIEECSDLLEQTKLNRDFWQKKTADMESKLQVYWTIIPQVREALERTVDPLEWWSQDYPNDGKFTKESHGALTGVKEALSLLNATFGETEGK